MTQHPNILLITTDQQHFSAFGTVNPRIHTPNLDRLCRKGTRSRPGVLPCADLHTVARLDHHRP